MLSSMRVIGWVMLLLTAPGISAMETALAPRYVSIDCPAGDLDLMLASDSTFTLTLARWDSVTNQHTSTEHIQGRWSAKGTTVTLSSKEAALTYVQDTVAIAMGSRSYRIVALRWTKSSRPTFADGFSLLEQEAVDRAFGEATPPGGGV